METYFVVIKDLNTPEMLTVTEMVVTGMTHIGGDIVRFTHMDDTATVINVKPGWSIAVETITETD